jgi:hypothetical protein
MIIERISIFDVNGRDVAIESYASASSLATGYSVGSMIAGTGSPITYRSKEKMYMIGGGIDNRRENNMTAQNVVEVDLGESVPVASLRIRVPPALDSWKMFYCKVELMDANRRVWAASEPLFHHHGRGHIVVNGGAPFGFDTYPTEEMFARSKLTANTFDIPVSRFPRWNTIRGGGVHFEPKMNIDYSELIYMGSKFRNVGYRSGEIDLPFAAAN